MYFDNVDVFNLEQNIDNLDTIYAHTKEGHKEKLKEHVDLTYEYFLKIIKEKNLDLVFKNIERRLLKGKNKTTIDIWKELIANTVYMHDIGKISANFQYRVMDNERYKDIKQVNSKHSMLSAHIYFDYFLNKISKLEEDSSLLLVFLILNSYIISKHHSSLANLSDFKKTFYNEYKNYSKQRYLYEDYSINFDIDDLAIESIFKLVYKTLEEIENSEIWSCIDIYIYTKLLFSLLVTSDFYATSNYMTGKSIDDFGTIKDYKKLDSIYKDGKVLKTIYQYKGYLNGEGENPFKENDINLLRTEIFLEAEKNLIKNKEENIFYLEAPTGSGKTNTSINLAFNLLKENSNINKIFYVFPFNTLVEQTKESLDEVFENHEDIKNQIAIINSITPIKAEDEEEENKEIFINGLSKKIDYEKSLLNRQFLHYPIVLTTHVNFFNYLFGNSRESVFALSHIANSIIILDEIQSYKNYIWKEIIIFLKKYAEILNIKIIIMSATLPKLDALVGTEKGFVSLIENREIYYNNPLFKNRVTIDYSLLNETDDIDKKVIEKIVNLSKGSTKNILVEFINKNTAMKMYKEIGKIYEEKGIARETLLMTGDDNKIERKQIIDKVKEQKNITLIATQVIEAGINIDMDIGFKDISILDSEEQFLGRINRSCMKSGSVVYFFNLDKASTIYKNDYRKNDSVTLKEEKIKDILRTKRFDQYYKIIMEMIENDLYRHDDRNIDKFRKSKVLKLDYEAITERMELIDDDKKEYQVFLNRKIKDKEGKIISGKNAWNNYVKLLESKDMKYAEKKVKLSYIIEKMDYFMYKVNAVNNSYMDVVGDIFYIENGEKYFTDGKFDRELFKNKGC